MKVGNILKHVALCFSLMCAAYAVASERALPNNALYSAKVVRLNTQEVLFEKNAHIAMVPASTLKILTTYLAVRELGPEFSFATQALVHGDDLYIKFSGDPTLTAQDLTVLVQSAFQENQPNIKHVYLDDSIFGGENYPPGSIVDVHKFCYAAPVSAIMLDRGCAQFEQVKPGVFQYSGSNNAVVLSYNAHERQADEECTLDLINTGPNEYELTGCYEKQGVKSLPSQLKVAIDNPRKYARQVVAAALAKVDGGDVPIDFKPTPQQAQMVLIHNSAPLDSLQQEMLGESSNQIANALTRYMTYEHFGRRPASWYLVESFMMSQAKRYLGSELGDIKLVDGAGLSYKNRVSANFMMQLLSTIWKDKKMLALFVDWLPQPGMEKSTLEKRFANQKVNGKIYAKTGSLDYTSSIAGFVLRKDGNDYAFVMLANNHAPGFTKAKEIEEKFISRILE